MATTNSDLTVNRNTIKLLGDRVSNGVHEANLQFKVDNRGNDAAEASRYKVVVRNPFDGNSEIVVAEGDIPAIGQNRSATITAYDVTAVLQESYPELMGLDLKFELTVDSDNVIVESSEGNNTAYRVFDIPHLDPDLTMYRHNIKLLGDRVSNGVHEANLQFRVDNRGNDAAEASRYKVVVHNPLDRNNEIVVAEGDIPAIGQGRFATITALDVTAVLQESYPELMGRDLKFEITVDSDNIVVESNEDNNTAYQYFDIPHLDPDLTMYRHNIKLLGDRVSNGVHEANLQFRVDNRGNDAAEASRYKVVVHNPLDRNSEIVVAEGDIPAIGQGRFATITALDVTAVLQESYPELMGRDLKFEITVDSDNIVVESNEDNNTAYQYFDIPHLDPDLTMYRHNIKLLGDRVSNGVHEANLQFRVDNRGNDAAEASRYKVVVHNPLDRNSEIVVAEGDIPAIGQGRFATITALDVTAVLQESYPELMGRDLKFEITVDSDNIVVESNEDNNTAYQYFDIPHLDPDLTMYRHNIKLLGDRVSNGVHEANLQFRVDNRGNDAAEASRYKVVVHNPLDRNSEIVVAEGDIPAIGQGRFATITALDVTAVLQESYPELMGRSLKFEVIVDSDNTIVESNEDNNTAYQYFDTPEIRPDLSVRNLGIVEGEILDGTMNFDLEFDYALNGVFERHGDIGYKVVVYSTSTPGVEFIISEGQIPYTQSVATGHIVIEDAGQSIYTGSGFDFGDDFEFRVEIDHDQLVSETNENNNTDTLGEFLPDIVTDAFVTGTSISDLPDEDSFIFTATLGGNNNLSATIDYNVVAVDQTTGDIYSIASGTSGLDMAGESEIIEIQNLRALLDDAGAASDLRNYVITAALDPENLLVESFEFNNSGSALIEL